MCRAMFDSWMLRLRYADAVQAMSAAIRASGMLERPAQVQRRAGLPEGASGAFVFVEGVCNPTQRSIRGLGVAPVFIIRTNNSDAGHLSERGFRRQACNRVQTSFSTMRPPLDRCLLYCVLGSCVTARCAWPSRQWRGVSQPAGRVWKRWGSLCGAAGRRGGRGGSDVVMTEAGPVSPDMSMPHYCWRACLVELNVRDTPGRHVRA